MCTLARVNRLEWLRDFCLISKITKMSQMKVTFLFPVCVYVFPVYAGRIIALDFTKEQQLEMRYFLSYKCLLEVQVLHQTQNKQKIQRETQ